MRIVFFGTPDWAVPSLEALARSSHSPLLIVTQPQKRRGRGSDLSSSPVAETGARLGLPVIAPESVKSQTFLAQVTELAPDLFVVVAYGKIFPRGLLSIPPAASINLHFSLLPAYRGAAPVQWAIAQGETQTGVTSMRMVAELDAGPIYLQEKVAIQEGEHAHRLGARLAEIGASLLLATVEGIATGSLRAREQDASLASYARILKPEDGWIDWSSAAPRIVQRVRGFDPWPGQASRSQKGTLKILEARSSSLPPQTAVAPGCVLGEANGSVRIACGGGSVLEAVMVQPEGRRSMSGSEALRGRHLRTGETLRTPDAAQG